MTDTEEDNFLLENEEEGSFVGGESIKTPEKSGVDVGLGVEEAEPEEVIKPPSTPSIYLESQIELVESCPSLRSLYPPKSYPSTLTSVNYTITDDTSIIKQTSQEKLNREYSIATLYNLGDVVDHHLTEDIDNKAKKEHTESVKSAEPKTEIKSILKESTKPRKDDFPQIKPLKDVIALPIPDYATKNITFFENLIISYDTTSECTEELMTFQFNYGEQSFPKSFELLPNFSQEVGAYCLRIEQIENDSYLTFCTSQLSWRGNCGSKSILSVTDPHMNLLEELRTETQCCSKIKTEKKLHLVKELSNFVAFKTEKIGEEKIEHRCDINLDVPGNLVQDGGLFVLMRYLISLEFEGVVETWSMDLAGELCRSVLDVGKIRVIEINKTSYPTIRIKRKLYRRYIKKPEISKTYFLSNGYMVRHQWKGCKYFLHLNPQMLIGKIPLQIERLEETWKNDVVMWSKFLDEKEDREAEIETYLEDHPEIKNIMKDYLLCILSLKPTEILQFTIEHFLNLFKE